MKSLSKNCTVCKSNQLSVIKVSSYTYLKCLKCKHLFLSKKPKYIDKVLYDYNFYKNYSSIGYEKYYKTNHIDNSKKIKLIKKYLPLNSKVLEIGCGPGFFFK